MKWRTAWFAALVGVVIAAAIMGTPTSAGGEGLAGYRVGALAAATSPVHVQNKYAEVFSGTTVRLRLPQPAVAGNLLVVSAVWSNSGSVSVSDSRGDTFETPGIGRTTWAGGYSAQVLYAKNLVGGRTTVVASFSKPVSFGLLYVNEYAGLDISDPVDSSRATASSGMAMNSGSITTTRGGDLIYGAGASVGAVSNGGSGFTVRSFAGGNIVEDRVGAAAGRYSATASHGGGGWVMQAVAFKPRATGLTTSSSTASATPTSTVAPTSNATTQTSTTPPTSSRSCPAFPAFPDSTCTGVPAGQSLTVVTTDQVYGPSFNGQTISNKDFRGWVTVTGANITFKNSIFRGRTANGANHALLDTEDSSGTIVVTDSEFVPSNPSATIDGLWTRNTNIHRANIHGSVDGLKANSNTLVEDSFIHDMSYFSSDPNQGGGPTHNDGVQTFAGESHVTLRHNKIDISMTYDANATWQSSGYYSRAENNYLDGGGCSLNFDAKSLGGPTLTPIYVNRNHFGRHQAATGCVLLISNKTVMTEYDGNVWHDNGQAVPRWQQHD